MEEYKGRLLRISDRENHIFMEALLHHINDEENFIGRLTDRKQRREVLDLLI